MRTHSRGGVVSRQALLASPPRAGKCRFRGPRSPLQTHTFQAVQLVFFKLFNPNLLWISMKKPTTIQAIYMCLVMCTLPPPPPTSAHLAKQIVRRANASGLSLAGSRSSVLTCLERAWGWEGREEVPFWSCSRKGVGRSSPDTARK